MSLQASWQLQLVGEERLAFTASRSPARLDSPCCETRRCRNKFGAASLSTPITLSVLYRRL